MNAWNFELLVRLKEHGKTQKSTIDSFDFWSLRWLCCVFYISWHTHTEHLKLWWFSTSWHFIVYLLCFIYVFKRMECRLLACLLCLLACLLCLLACLLCLLALLACLLALRFACCACLFCALLALLACFGLGGVVPASPAGAWLVRPPRASAALLAF